VLIDTEVSCAGPTSMREVLLNPSDDAVIVTCPSAKPCASPPALMETTPAGAAAHVTEAVRFLVLPSLYCPLAVNCCDALGHRRGGWAYLDGSQPRLGLRGARWRRRAAAPSTTEQQQCTE
jgi:hypothetical protein